MILWPQILFVKNQSKWVGDEADGEEFLVPSALGKHLAPPHMGGRWGRAMEHLAPQQQDVLITVMLLERW